MDSDKMQYNEPKKFMDVLICIDIGHNVKGDNGSQCDWGLDENSCAKQIGESLKKVLEKWGYKTMFSFTEEDKAAVEAIKDEEDSKPENEQDKTKPMFESLRRRCLNANKNQAQLFVAIHMNSNGDIAEKDKGRGTTVYVKTNNERLLGNLILNQAAAQHYDLGSGEFSDGVKMLGKPYKNNGVKSGENLYVIRNTFCPAILIECAFVDNAMDTELYKDKKPYINHEHCTLEEGVGYVNENVLSYNFFAYSIARGIHDYITGNFLQSYEPQKVDSYETTEMNYVCYMERGKDSKIESIVHKTNAKEHLCGGRVFSLVSNEANKCGDNITIAYGAFKNTSATQASYLSIMRPSAIQEAKVKNLANLGECKEFNGKKAIIFKLKGICNVYRSDGSPYCTLGGGCSVGIYLKETTNPYVPAFASEKTYEKYDFAKGPVVCEPTKPYWIKINFAIRQDEKIENLYNEYTGDDYAWIETNLPSVLDISDFVFESNK